MKINCNLKINTYLFHIKNRWRGGGRGGERERKGTLCTLKSLGHLQMLYILLDNYQKNTENIFLILCWHQPIFRVQYTFILPVQLYQILSHLIFSSQLRKCLHSALVKVFSLLFKKSHDFSEMFKVFLLIWSSFHQK